MTPSIRVQFILGSYGAFTGLKSPAGVLEAARIRHGVKSDFTGQRYSNNKQLRSTRKLSFTGQTLRIAKDIVFGTFPVGQDNLII